MGAVIAFQPFSWYNGISYQGFSDATFSVVFPPGFSSPWLLCRSRLWALVWVRGRCRPRRGLLPRLWCGSSLPRLLGCGGSGCVCVWRFCGRFGSLPACGLSVAVVSAPPPGCWLPRRGGLPALALVLWGCFAAPNPILFTTTKEVSQWRLKIHTTSPIRAGLTQCGITKPLALRFYGQRRYGNS
jgi:hypothetical protein